MAGARGIVRSGGERGRASGAVSKGIGARLADGIPRQRAEGGHAKKCVWGGSLALYGAPDARKRGKLRFGGAGCMRWLKKGKEQVRRAREWGVFEICKTNYVVKTTEFEEKAARRTWKWGIFGIYKMNYVVKTTEFEEKLRARRGNGVFSRIAKRITLLKQRNLGRDHEVGAISKWKAVRVLAHGIGGWRWESADTCEREHGRQVCGISRRHADGGLVQKSTRLLDNGAGGGECPRCRVGV